MSDYRCLYPGCGWEGNKLIEDLDGNMLCPECENDDIEATDSVSYDDYREQNPLERPSD